ncbi:MAG: FAD-dependent oxidoreductase, partial [Acidimicrobiales bacterium]
MTTGGSHVIVIGAGVAGLGSALALSRSGHRVTLLERDATPLPADPDAAFLWDRRGAPQVRHSHALLARLRNLLRDRYPDVLDALIEAGATEMRFAENLPVDITDREPRPGDEDLVALACRRTTFEWVLRRAVLAADGVQLLDGTVAESLVATHGTDGAPPTVTGVVVTAKGQGARTIEGDLVVATVGRRSAVPRLLSNIGVDPTGTSEDTGIVYLSRFYRLLD